MESKISAKDKRTKFRQALQSGKLQRFPGAFSPLVAKLIQDIGFEGVYISGAVISNNLGLPDIGLTTLTEVSQVGLSISRVTDLPTIIDGDTGFGETANVARTIQAFEDAGVCAFHLEDQVNPKRCGHLDNKQIVPTGEMIKKVKSASSSKRDSDFVIIARTDARASEGLEKAIARAQAYVDAGADMIFPEALENEKEFEAFRKEIKVPLLANMTEFGKSKLLDTKTLESLGYNVVIYPVTSLRLALKAVEDGLREVAAKGTQESLLNNMQTRKRLYELVEYDEYSKFDQDIFNFKI